MTGGWLTLFFLLFQTLQAYLMSKPALAKIHTGIIGGGLSARIFHGPFLVDPGSDFELVAFHRSRNEAVAGHDAAPDLDTVPVYTKLDEFLALDPLELVIVTTPSHVHVCSLPNRTTFMRRI